MQWFVFEPIISITDLISSRNFLWVRQQTIGSITTREEARKTVSICQGLFEIAAYGSTICNMIAGQNTTKKDVVILITIFPRTFSFCNILSWICNDSKFAFLISFTSICAFRETWRKVITFRKINRMPQNMRPVM